jgi:uncharacterized protein
MRFLLSIHDVWPGNYPLVEDYLGRLRALGAGPVALLVVPAYHGTAPMYEDAAFMAWLGEKGAEGTEILLHGYRHWMPERAEPAGYRSGRSRWGSWVNRRMVDGEAEFCGLPGPERERLLESGTEVFRRAGMPNLGFVSPTWHGSPSSAMLRSRGFHFWETRFFLHCLSRGVSRFAPALTWSPGANGKEPSMFGGSLWSSLAMGLPLVRVAIHPGDLRGKAVMKILEKLLVRGKNIRYADDFK